MNAVARLLRFSRVPEGAREAATLATSIGLGDGDAQALFGFVRRLGLSDAQADDAVQETHARLLSEFRRGIVVANPRAWAFRTIFLSSWTSTGCIVGSRSLPGGSHCGAASRSET